MKLLFLAWQDPLARLWYTVGRLTEETGCFRFEYTCGAKNAKEVGFCPLPSFPDLYARYESPDLFPLFTNRLLSRSRPDYAEFVQWLSLPVQENDPFAMLARSGGLRATDTLVVFPCPEPDEEGCYHVHAFVHGLSHMPLASIAHAETLSYGERLLVQHDMQNPVEPGALAVRTTNFYPLGFIPQYLVGDFNTLLSHTQDIRESLIVTVERLNPAPAPVQFRILCCVMMQWQDDFQPFSSYEYQSINRMPLDYESPNVATKLKELAV